MVVGGGLAGMRAATDLAVQGFPVTLLERSDKLGGRIRELNMTFPEDYEFVAPGEPIHIKTIGRLIGNAVPVDLGRVIAQSIKRHLADHLN